MKTSWEKAHKWYDLIVGKKGHYYHKTLILPESLRLLNLQKKSSLLDLGCGQGILSRNLPQQTHYLGIDSSKTLIEKATSYSNNPNHRFLKADVEDSLNIGSDFTHGCFILSLQNMKNSKKALQTASKHLKKDALLLIVLNHPCFRIPRQSTWETNYEKKQQSRKIERYMSDLTIPITTHPGKNSTSTFSFHKSLSAYSEDLFQSGFSILKIEEWCSDKVSTGKYAKMENRARKEFPLFLVLLARKS